MPTNIAPRTIRSGPFLPTQVRSGDAGGTIFRKNNMVTRGRGANLFEQSFTGLGDLGESTSMSALSGTLNLNEGSTTINGFGTAFQSECHLGQYIVAIDGFNSWLLVVRRIISQSEMVVWQAPDSTVAGVSGFRMPIMFAINDQRGTALRGDAAKLDKGSYLGVGSGPMLVNGSILPGTSLVLSRSPQLALFDPATETYTTFVLGMDTPVPPTLAALGGGTKGMQGGSYSIVITPARKQTNGYNNPSDRADVTIATNDQIAITLPAMDVAHGQNAWFIWVTTFADSLGADLNYLNGPWHLLGMVDDTEVSSAGGTINREWLDAEVERNDLVTFDNDAPVDAEFVALLNNNPVFISCQGQGYAAHPVATSPGPFIVPTKPGNIEAAPLTLAFSSSPPETILGVVSAQGRLYLLTSNHLQIAQATPDNTVPILIRPFWKDGFANPYQLVFVNGDLYGFPTAGPTRSIGDGDETWSQRDWAEDIAEYTLTWNPGQVMVGYDPFNDGVVYFHSADRRNSSGFWTTRWLMFGISQNFWIGSGELSSDTQDMIVSGLATVGDRLELVVGGGGSGGSCASVRFDAGLGDVDWFIAPPVSDSDNELRSKHIKAAHAVGKWANANFMMYAYDVSTPIDATALEAGTGSATGAIALADNSVVAQSPRVQLNVPNADLSTIRLGGTATGGVKAEVHSMTYELSLAGVRR